MLTRHPLPLRCSYAFVFEYRDISGKVLAWAKVTAADVTYASQAHISLTHDPTEMRIVYNGYWPPAKGAGESAA